MSLEDRGGRGAVEGAAPSVCAIVAPSTRLDDMVVVGFDLETTGLSAWRGDRVCEVGLVRATREGIEDVMSVLVDPGRPIPPTIEALTGIHNSQVVGAPRFEEVLPALLLAIGNHPIVIHNAPFDLAFLYQACVATGRAMPANLTVDTLLVARHLSQGAMPSSLGCVSDRLGIAHDRSHRAVDDARTAARVFFAMLPELARRDVECVDDLMRCRLAADAAALMAAPSSVVLDMLTRAIHQGESVEMTCARGTTEKRYRVRPVELVADRELVAVISDDDTSGQAPEPGGDQNREGERRRTFRVIDIMSLDFEGCTYVSPWSDPADA